MPLPKRIKKLVIKVIEAESTPETLRAVKQYPKVALETLLKGLQDCLANPKATTPDLRHHVRAHFPDSFERALRRP